MNKILAILPISIGGRLTTSSIIDGFKQNNYNVDIIDELKNYSFKNKKYKYIVGYGFSPIVFKIENNLSIPTIAYFSDIIQSSAAGIGYDKFQNELKKIDNHIFYWDRELSKKEGWNYLAHFVNCEIYRPFKEPTADVIFMGRFDTDLRLNTFLELNKRLPEVKFKWYAIKKHFENALSRCNSSEDKNILTNSYSGFIDNEEDMANAINDSKIVYNINAQGISSLNYRTFQTMACERLLISDKIDQKL